tara:strand:+ start:343 stop:453 length:111 start_codon:yes stop_codon:yes gene_type:complete
MNPFKRKAITMLMITGSKTFPKKMIKKKEKINNIAK